MLRVGYTGWSLKVGASWLRGDDRLAGDPRQQPMRGAGKVMFRGLGADCGAQKKGKERGTGA